MPGPDEDEASSSESSSFDTDDEKDIGRETEIYLTLDQVEGFVQDWKDRPRPNHSSTRQTSANSGFEC